MPTTTSAEVKDIEWQSTAPYTTTDDCTLTKDDNSAQSTRIYYVLLSLFTFLTVLSLYNFVLAGRLGRLK